jgi:glycosyltransferase involved in cell wall biosynthesis
MTEPSISTTSAPDALQVSGGKTAPVTCYIRTLNEERRIGEVIRAARQVVDEVVLVDCGSTDKTLEIAAAEGAKVVKQAWLGNGAQKRVGEDAAKHDWLLDLDADEIVTPELAEAIGAVFESGPTASIYEVPLVTVPPIGKPWKNFKIAWRRKLYNRTTVRIPDSKVWDQFDVPAGERVRRINKPLLHYSFANIEHVVTKMNKVSSTRARESKLKSFPGTVLRVWFGFPSYFIKEYFFRGLIRGGTYGFAFAMTMSFARWMRDVKMYERHMLMRRESKGGQQ